MKKLVRFPIFVFLFTVILVSNSFAGLNYPRKFPKKVTINTPTVMDFRFVYWHDSCKPFKEANIQIRLIDQPEHGKVSITKGTIRNLTKDFTRTKYLNCIGKSINGWRILYNPSKNYRGEDGFTVQFKYNSMTWEGKKIKHIEKKKYLFSID